ncbi:MAG: NIPSNAP family protein [Microthrixaceae bacterium]
MAVATVVQWKINPQQVAKFTEQVATAKGIHERLGGEVRVWTNMIGGEPQTVNYIIQHADMAAFAKFSDAMAADDEWQAFWLAALTSPDQTATMLGNALMQEMPGV